MPKSKSPWERAYDSVRTRNQLILRKFGWGAEKLGLFGINSVSLLGTKEQFKSHIEGGFYGSKMSWDRFGKGRHCWQVDHIRPVSNFDGDITMIKFYFSLSNLQPLWYCHNMAKSNLEPASYGLSLEADKALWKTENNSHRNEIVKSYLSAVTSMLKEIQ